ncbi:unnamed protein product [Prorocentrum cordatum]|nr:unnamed protein product [Polarella glacialis]CAK0828209.1 unnamed protein product [Polarella glacialis]
MCQMMRALKCCHAHYIGHFDIKPENFMYTRPDKVHLKLIDLGLSSSFKRDSSEVRGSVPYMAPEVWDGTCGPEADIWSCGVVLFEMLTGTNFLGDPGALGDSEARRRVRDRAWVRQRLREARECRELSPEAQDFLSLLLRHDRHRRPTAREALGHPFLASTDPLGLYPPEVVRRAEESAWRTSRGPAGSSRPSPCWSAGLFCSSVLAVAHFSAYCFPQTRPQRLAFALADAGSDGELSISGAGELLSADRGVCTRRTRGGVPRGGPQ